ncbi:putative UPF0481 protein At3g02645 [Chenopodium quinoa]|uniref:putative UPF0481 protein At3g02645 n=1 Tax=Chenopodium quinoa TaxID=63459 RepID=UPI000B77D2D3|nr:putative UPF0481 protein At3g02645 [Chenopodium quinoa]
MIDDEIEEDDGDIHVSIFNVPNALRDINPNAYTPQLVALGPYHYRRFKLQEMERYKISSAKRFQNRKQSTKLHTIVDQLIMLDHRIRACYHKYLDISRETLAWKMAIDSAFLLEIIDIYSNKEGKFLCQTSSKIVDFARRKSVYNTILRDIMMLENQIPLFVLRKISNYWFHSSNMVDEILDDVLVGLCKDVSPFKMLNWAQIQPSSCAHILEFLYKRLTPKVEETVEIDENVNQGINEERRLCKLLSQLKESLHQIPLKAVFKLPWIFICSLPGLAILSAVVLPKENNFENPIDTKSTQDNMPPLFEEIMIPSVIELSKSGVTFLPVNGDIMSINFDQKSKKFYLPTISIDDNTEVILRNLVAFEASSTLGPLVFTRYTEVMNGIIDTKDDVRLLREKGIILNYLRSDEEVANLWNGMSKSLRLTRVSFLDEVIDNVNRYYEGNWKVLLSRFMNACLINSWQFLVFIVAALILSLLILQVLGSLLYNSRMVGPHPQG